MTARARAAVAIVSAAVALAAIAWWAFSRPEGFDPDRAPSPSAAATSEVAAPTAVTTIPTPTDGSRREAAADPGLETAPPPDVRHGFRGIVRNERDDPLSGVAVHLLASSANEPLALPWILQQRLPVGPLASARSGADGTFAIGLPVAQDRIYELFFVATAHAAVRLAKLSMREDEWVDVGTITLVPGVTVTGRVTVEGGTAPVPGAVVSVEAGATFVDAALRALPAGEQGLSASVDATGRYELPHTPRLGVVRLSAIAPGFARVVHSGANLSGDVPLQIDFALPPGLTIRGRVTEGRDAVVAGARIEAWPQQTSSSALVATSDRDGRFLVQNLAAGTYAVRIVARGFQSHEQVAVPAGGDELVVSLTRNGAARLRVRSSSGDVVRSFHASLRRFLPDRGNQLAFVSEVPDQRLRLDAQTDVAEIAGIPAGTFVFQIASEGFAPTLSPPFQIDDVVRSGDVEVVLTTGATLRGQVLDEAGRPLAAATVTTQPDGAQPDSPMWRVLASAEPDRITATTATTDADGRFELPLLAFAQYQIEIRHREVCVTREPGIRLDVQGVRTLPPIRMQRGALVIGRATRAGSIAPGMKIVLMSPSNGAGRSTDGLRLETVTDADGFFQLPLRVPPGMYELRAAVVDTADSPGGHIRHLHQLQRSATPLAVTAGQDRIERDIDLPNDH